MIYIYIYIWICDPTNFKNNQFYFMNFYQIIKLLLSKISIDDQSKFESTHNLTIKFNLRNHIIISSL